MNFFLYNRERRVILVATKIEKKADRKKRRDEELHLDADKEKGLTSIRESRKMKNWSSDKWRWFLFFITLFLLWFIFKYGA